MSERQIPKGYKHTEIGVIPEDWGVKTLGELGQFKNGINKNKSEFGRGYPFVNLMDVFGAPRLSGRTACLGLVNSSSIERKTYDLIKGDILFVRSSVKPEGVGLSSLVDETLPSTVFSGFLIRYRPIDKVVSAYLQYCFSEERFHNRLIANSTVSANTNINQNVLKRFIIAFPCNLAEQHAIAEALSGVDGLLAALDKLIAKKRAIKKAAMQQLLTGKTRLPGFSGEWEMKQLGDIAAASWGNTSITKNQYRDLGFTAFSASGPDGYLNWYEHEQPAVILSAIGALCGKTWLSCNKWTAIKNTIWFRGLEGGAVTNFLFWATANPEIWPNRGQAQPFITLGDVKALPICVPPIKEQSAIASVLSDMDAEIEALERRREKTRQVKQGMMQQLLTGRVRLVKPEYRQDKRSPNEYV